MSNFIVDSSAFGGVQRQIGFIIEQVGFSTKTTGTQDAFENKVSDIKHEEIDPRDEKMVSFLDGINVDIKGTCVGLATVGIWTGSPKIYETSAEAAVGLNTFGIMRNTEEAEILSVIVSAAASGSSTGLTTTGPIAIGATEYLEIPVGAAVSQFVFNTGIGTYEQVAGGIVGVNTGNFLLVKNVTGSFITTSTLSISTSVVGENPVGFQTFTFPHIIGFTGITPIRKDVIMLEKYDSYEPTMDTSVFPKETTTKEQLTSGTVGLGFSQFHYTNGYDTHAEAYLNDTLIGPTISDQQTFPRVQSPQMTKVVYTTDNTTNNNQIVSLESGISTYRVGIPTYLAASCTVKEYKTEIQDAVWGYAKGATLTGDSKTKYQSYYDAMDQGDPEMDVNVPPAPPADPPRTPDDDEVDV